MKQTPPPQLPGPQPQPLQARQRRPDPALPPGPAVVPVLPTRLRQPGRQAPLPDAVAVRRLAVPDPAPPYDDEVAAEGENPYAGDPGSGGPAPAGPGPGDPACGDPPSGDRPAGDPGPRGPGGDQARTDPARGWPSQFAQVLAETLAGSRPPQQLTPWTTEQARRRIRQLGPMLATDQRPKVRRVMTSAPAAGVLEMTAVVGFGPRVRVLALRLEREQGRPYRQGGGSRWCCTAIESA